MDEYAHIEKRLESYEARFEGIEKAIRDIPRMISESSDRALKSMIAQIGARRSSDSPIKESNANSMIVSFIGIIIALSAALIGAVFIGQGKQVESIEKRMASHSTEPGHHSMVEKNAETQVRIDFIKDQVDFWKQAKFFNEKMHSGVDPTQTQQIKALNERIKLLEEQKKGSTP